jgi:hypothetical protein
MPQQDSRLTAAGQLRTSPTMIYKDSQGGSTSSPVSLRSSPSNSTVNYSPSSTTNFSYTNSSNNTSASSPSPYSDIQSFIHSYTDSCGGLYSDSLTASYTSGSGLYSDSMSTSYNSCVQERRRMRDEKEEVEEEEKARRGFRVSPIKSQDSGYSDSEEGGSHSQEFVSRVFVPSMAAAATTSLPMTVSTAQSIHSNEGSSVSHASTSLTSSGRKVKTCRKCLHMAKKQERQQQSAALATANNLEGWDKTPVVDRGQEEDLPELMVGRRSPPSPQHVEKMADGEGAADLAPHHVDKMVDGAGDWADLAPRNVVKLADGGGGTDLIPHHVDIMAIGEGTADLSPGHVVKMADGGGGGTGLSRCPVSHWLSELPSLQEPECTNMLQSKAILAELSLTTLIMENLRRVQSQGLQVTRLFATICR